MKNANTHIALNPAQIMVLQVVKERYDEHDLEDLRQLLLDFNHNRMQKHLDEAIEQKGYATADFERMINGHERKKSS